MKTASTFFPHFENQKRADMMVLKTYQNLIDQGQFWMNYHSWIVLSRRILNGLQIWAILRKPLIINNLKVDGNVLEILFPFTFDTFLMPFLSCFTRYRQYFVRFDTQIVSKSILFCKSGMHVIACMKQMYNTVLIQLCYIITTNSIAHMTRFL